MIEDNHFVQALSALAHQDRVRAFRLLVSKGPSGLPSGEIAATLDIAPTRMSFHLATLERASLLTSWRDGRKILYAVHFENMRQLLTFLTEDCCNGAPEICGGIGGAGAFCAEDENTS